MKDMLKDQVAIVTGGNSGMGEASAKAFAREGAKVVIVARNEKNSQRVVDEITAEGGIARFYGRTDVSNKEEIEAVVKKTFDEFGRKIGRAHV